MRANYGWVWDCLRVSMECLWRAKKTLAASSYVEYLDIKRHVRARMYAYELVESERRAKEHD